MNSSLSLISNKTKIGANNNFQKKTNTSPKNAPKIAEGKAVFEIKDNGCGIPPKQLDRLFTGHSIADDRPADSRKKNAGIGLSVCAAIIKAHGGIIEAENIKTGGAVFRFALATEELKDDTE